MSFANPWLLLGLLGLGLPVAAHLLGRREPERVPFAAVRFLEAREPRVARRRKLHDRGLLALRLLMWAALVIALARPFTLRPAQVSVYGEPHDAVILVDSSASMQARVGESRRIDLALSRARELVDAMPAGSRVALITSERDGPRESLAAPSSQQVESLAQWVDAQLTGHARPLADALDDAYATLGPAGERPQVIYAVSDATAQGLGSLPAQTQATLGGEAVLLIPVLAASEAETETGSRAGSQGPATPPENLSLGRVTWGPARDLDPRAMRIRVPLRYAGGPSAQAVQVELALEIEGRSQAQTQVSLDANSETEVEFTHTFVGELDSAAAAVSIVGASDALAADDRREFWLDSEAGLRVAVVNGDPSERREFDEVFFLLTAMRAADPRGRTQVRGLAPDQLEEQVRSALAAKQQPLNDIDVLVLANTPPPSAGVTKALQARVEAGMGLWISVGDRVSPQPFNQAFGDILPLRLRSASFAGTAPGRAAARVEGLAPAHLAHPLFAGLGADLDLATTRTRRLFLLEPDAARNVDTALSFASGAPALITRELGRGRVALLTTSVDRDWSDLALRPGFVPLVERTLAWLGGDKNSGQQGVVFVGETLEFAGDVDWLVRGPDGVERPSQRATDRPVATYANTRATGLYSARPRESAQQGGGARRFAVQVDPIESDLRAVELPPRKLDEALPVQGRTPRWRELLALAALLLAFEAFMRTRAAQRDTQRSLV